MRFCELREKEVVNLCNCRRLGCVADIILVEICEENFLKRCKEC